MKACIKSFRFWLEEVWLCLSDCWVEFRKTGFLWKAIGVVILLLWVLLVFSEGVWGDTKTREKISTVGAKALHVINADYEYDGASDYWLVRSCSWRKAIASDRSEILRLLGDTLYLTFIAVTTVGFGDIVPTTGMGRAIAVVDAIVGFLAFGLYVNTIIYGLRGHMILTAELEKTEE